MESLHVVRKTVICAMLLVGCPANNCKQSLCYVPNDHAYQIPLIVNNYGANWGIKPEMACGF